MFYVVTIIPTVSYEHIMSNVLVVNFEGLVKYIFRWISGTKHKFRITHDYDELMLTRISSNVMIMIILDGGGCGVINDGKMTSNWI